ncbi:MAG TPA: hypothetical protein VFY91_12295 [Microbacterium sp.]|nr:hypothetical protein [Microbacterium sp.]
MDEGAEAELQRLRARAYGPGADIQKDPLALRRLNELERLRSADDPPSSEEASEDDGIGADESLQTTAGENGVDHEPEADPREDEDAPAEDGAPAKPRRRIGTKWVAAIWVVSLIVVALIAAATTRAAVPPAPLVTGARHIATLQESPAFVWPQFLGEEPPDSRGFEEFYGLTPVAADFSFTAGSTDTCIALVPSAQLAPESRPNLLQSIPGCGAGAFTATVQIVVRGELPPQLLSGFPEGTALQFVLDGSRVHVYSAAGD